MKKQLLFLIMFGIGLQTQAQFVQIGGPNLEAKFSYLWARNDTAFAAMNENLWRTTDGGASWEQLLNKGLPEEVDPRAITVARNIVFIGTNNDARVYTSPDWGETWSATADGGSAIWVPTHLASDGQDVAIGGTLFSPFYFDFDQNKWISSGLSGTTHALRYFDDGTLMASVGSASRSTTHLSSDKGETWTQLAAEPSIPVVGSARTFDMLKIGNRIVAVANFNGYNPQYTDDNGATWIEATGAKTYGATAYGRRFGRLADGTLLFNNGLMCTSTDSGKTWQVGTKYLGADFMPWKTNSIICSSGDIENGGSGNCNAFRMTTSGVGLIEYSNKIYTHQWIGFEQHYWYGYDGNTWHSDSVENHPIQSNIGTVHSTAVVDDSLFLLTSIGVFSGDNTRVAALHNRSLFGNNQIRALAKFGNTYLAGTHETRGNQKPQIYYSTDGRKTWTEASFTNNIGYGPGGTVNSVQSFLEHNGKLYADLSGGYAVSADNGVTWEWQGGQTGGNLVSTGSVLVRVDDPVFTPKSVKYSEDDGTTWTKVMTGIPGYSGQSNFADFGDVYEVDGVVYIDALVSPRKLMKFDKTAKEWVSTDENSELPQNGALLDLVCYDGILYANIKDLGVWKLDATVGRVSSLKKNLKVYPNPTLGKFHIPTKLDKLTVYDVYGKEVLEIINPDGVVNISRFPAGVYYLYGANSLAVYQSKIIKK
ncbi:MAG: T9SS type A sorting domain-containing protein [Bacteroidia bacterium]